MGSNKQYLEYRELMRAIRAGDPNARELDRQYNENWSNHVPGQVRDLLELRKQEEKRYGKRI